MAPRTRRRAAVINPLQSGLGFILGGAAVLIATVVFDVGHLRRARREASAPYMTKRSVDRAIAIDTQIINDLTKRLADAEAAAEKPKTLHFDGQSPASDRDRDEEPGRTPPSSMDKQFLNFARPQSQRTQGQNNPQG